MDKAAEINAAKIPQRSDPHDIADLIVIQMKLL